MNTIHFNTAKYWLKAFDLKNKYNKVLYLHISATVYFETEDCRYYCNELSDF